MCETKNKVETELNKKECSKISMINKASFRIIYEEITTVPNKAFCNECMDTSYKAAEQHDWTKREPHGRDL